MISASSVRWLIRIAVAIAIPGIPCFAYYSLAYVDDAQGLLKLLIVLSGPLALIGGSTLVWGLLESRSSRRMVWLAGITLVLPVAFMLWVRT